MRTDGWDFFLCHYQKNAGTSVNALRAELEMHGKRCWLEQFETPSEEGIIEGACFHVQPMARNATAA